MRTNEDYNKLVEGYRFSLQLLKQVEPDIYDRFLKTIKILDKNGVSFAELIRNLRVDFSREHDEKEIDEPKIVVIDRPTCKEMYAISYSPICGWSLNMLCEKKSMLYNKSLYCQIFPTSFEELKQDNVRLTFEITKLDKNQKSKRSYEYIVGYAEEEEEIIVFKRDVNKPDKILGGYEIREKDFYLTKETDVF